MKADPTLAQWAYRAHSAGKEYKDIENQAILDMIKEMQNWNIQQKKKAGDYTEQAEEIADNDGALPPAEKENIRKEIDGDLKDKYINGDPAEQDEALAELEVKAQQAAEYQSIRKALGESVPKSELSEAFLRSDRGKDIMSLLSKDARLSKNTCPEGVDCENEGDWGVELTDFDVIDTCRDEIKEINGMLYQLSNSPLKEGETDQTRAEMIDNLTRQKMMKEAIIQAGPTKWTSLQTLKQSIKRVDEPSRDIFHKHAAKLKLEAANFLPEHGDPVFNRQKEQGILESTIIGMGDIESMVYDQMIPNRKSFYEEFKGFIKGDYNDEGRTYKDIGVMASQLEGADINEDDIIDDAEATVIVDAILADTTKDKHGKTYKQKYLSNWMTNYLQSEHKEGADSRRASHSKKDDDKEKKDKEKKGLNLKNKEKEKDITDMFNSDKE
tara:strand:- start:497 stop:1816 length:1320 start_codon:yes stop_codon:yes gene_type:complete